MWKYNQNLKCFLKDNRNVDVCVYWVYHSVMDKKTVPDGYRFSVHKYKNVMASGWKGML